jgi:hypothetical protein
MNREKAKALLQKKNVRAAVLASALAVTLVATVVSGREKASSENLVEPSVREAAQAAVQPSEELDLDKLRRAKSDAPVADLFGSADPEPARAADGQSAVAAAPVEQPLPFQYLGKVIDEGNTSVFLTLGSEPYSVKEGQTIDQYRVAKVEENAITFIHLPTGASKVLSVPPLN